MKMKNVKRTGIALVIMLGFGLFSAQCNTENDSPEIDVDVIDTADTTTTVEPTTVPETDGMDTTSEEGAEL